ADVRGLAAVRLLYAAPLVDQGAVRRLHAALGTAGGPSFYLCPLDTDRRAGPGEPLIAGAVRDRRPDVVQSLVARAWLEYRLLHLEMDAVLDRDFHRRANDDPEGAPRRRRDRRRNRLAPFRARHVTAARQPLSGVHAARHRLGD